MNDIAGTRVLMLATRGFADPELFEPLEMLRAAGVEVTIASIDKQTFFGVSWDEAAGKSSPSNKPVRPDITLSEALELQFDALLLPGGAANAEALRVERDAITLVRRYMNACLPVAAICHAVTLLIPAGALRGRRATAWTSVQPELATAGAYVLDQPVVIDANLITSRKPADIPAFTNALMGALADARALAYI